MPALAIASVIVGMPLGALFAGLDAALAQLGTVRLEALRDAGGPEASVAARAHRDLAVIQARLLTGRIVCLALVVTSVSRITGLDGSLGSIASVAGASLLYAVLAETAITVARARAGRWALVALRRARPLELLLAPLALPLVAVSRWLGGALPRPEPTPQEARVAELTVEHLIDESAASGSITRDRARLLRSALEFENTLAREVMVPRTHMVALDVTMPIDALLDRALAEGHSRYPVYRGTLDHIEGILHVKDLIRLVRGRISTEGLTVGPLLRRPYVVAETQKIGTLLREMQQRRLHLAIVVDEFGGTSGIVTLEDVLEELVGEIRDEHDEEEAPVREIAPGQWAVDAGVSVHDVSEAIGAPLVEAASGSYHSIGGLVVSLAGYVPPVGERIQVGAFDVFVRDADERRVRRVEIRRRSPPDVEAA